jgi:hypothetical protein
MTTISASIHIWVKTVLINFGLILSGAMVALKGFDVLWAFAFLFVGIIATIPVLLFINPIVVLSKRVTQYDIPARIALLTFHLMVMVFLFFILVSSFTTETIFTKNSKLASQMAGTIISLVLSVYISRNSLREMYEGK